MALDQYALISVSDYKAFADIEDSDIVVGGLQIYGSDGTGAEVDIKVGTIYLIKAGGTNPGTTTFALANPLYATLTLLLAAINATTGWVANPLARGEMASIDLVNCENVSCLGVAGTATFRIVDNYSIERMIERSTDIIEDLLHRHIKTRTYTNERYDCDENVDEVFLRNMPVTAVERISVGENDAVAVIYDNDNVFNAYVRVTDLGIELWKDGNKQATILFATQLTIFAVVAAINAQTGWKAVLAADIPVTWPSTLLIANTNVFCRKGYGDLQIPEDPVEEFKVTDEGTLWAPGWYWSGREHIYVTYTAGFTTVPKPIVEACCELTRDLNSQRTTDPTMQSESLGDYSYSVGSGHGSYSVSEIKSALTPQTWAKLMPYKRWLV